MKYRLSITAAVAVLLCPHVWAEGHCESGEKTFFSCEVRGGKVVSICGGSDWLQYRFGKLKHVEISFPSEKTDSLKQFTGASRFHKAVQVSAEYLMFERSGVEYSVTQMQGGSELLGVTVLLPGAKHLSELRCTSGQAIVHNLRAAVEIVPEGNP